MATTITSYDGGVVSTPQQFVKPETVEELQAVMRDADRYPGPVRAMGSYHSLTPCASSDGTIVSTAALNRIVDFDADRLTFTAQAGLQHVQAAEYLRKLKHQFMLNIEIGNMTLGSAACCQTKDSLDGTEFGQVNSYVTKIKWVNPSGGLEEASEEHNPELLSLVRASYGLCGVVYEVTFRIKPLEIVRFQYLVHKIDKLTEDRVSEIIASNESIVCWTVGKTVIIQTRNRAANLSKSWVAKLRRRGWAYNGAFIGRALRQHTPDGPLTNLSESVWSTLQKASYKSAAAIGGFAAYGPDKIINYKDTPPEARYAFSFWAFPRSEWVSNLKSYLEFADQHYEKHGFRCNIPLGSYFIRKDMHSLLSYTYDGDIISIDPIHAAGERDKAGWERFLREFNAWAHSRGGIPLLNQSPYVEKAHVVAAYGDRWKKLSDWIRTVDPGGRMVNPFFKELLL
jgi:FAD/FMN-containing dehydrogenase